MGGRSRRKGIRLPEVLLPAGSVISTGLYVAVRGIGGTGDRFAYIWRTGSGVVPTVRITARFPVLRRSGAVRACVEGVFDPLADEVLTGIDAVQVRVVQDAGAVAGPSRDFGGLAGG
jgi:hypothetical protein